MVRSFYKKEIKLWYLIKNRIFKFLFYKLEAYFCWFIIVYLIITRIAIASQYENLSLKKESLNLWKTNTAYYIYFFLFILILIGIGYIVVKYKSKKIKRAKVIDEIEIESINFNLRTIMKEIIVFFSTQCSEKNIKFEYSIDDNIPYILKGDPNRIRQTILNLLKNAKEFTELTGEKISIESRENTRSNFYFKICLEKTEEKNQNDKKELFQNKDIVQIKGKVFLIDDDKINLMITEEFLKSFGLEVTIAATLEEIKVNINNKFNLIISDINIGDKKIFGIIEELRNKGITIPVILMSADMLGNSRYNFKEMNIVDFLMKPLVREELYKKIKIFFKETDNIVNKEVIEIFSNNKEKLKQMIAIIEKETTKLLDEIIQAAEKKDEKVYNDKLHKLKGSMGFFAGDKIVEYVKDLKQTENIMDIKEKIDTLKKEIQNMILEMKKYG